jgi:hypothetical protein
MYFASSGGAEPTDAVTPVAEGVPPPLANTMAATRANTATAPIAHVAGLIPFFAGG